MALVDLVEIPSCSENAIKRRAELIVMSTCPRCIWRAPAAKETSATVTRLGRIFGLPVSKLCATRILLLKLSKHRTTCAVLLLRLSKSTSINWRQVVMSVNITSTARVLPRLLSLLAKNITRVLLMSRSILLLNTISQISLNAFCKTQSPTPSRLLAKLLLRTVYLPLLHFIRKYCFSIAVITVLIVMLLPFAIVVTGERMAWVTGVGGD